MTCLNLMAELSSHQRGESARRLSTLEECVERWCSIEAAAAPAITTPLPSKANSRKVAAKEGELEKLLARVGGLASELAMSNVTESSYFTARRSARQLARGLVASLQFIWRGLRIMASDISQCGVLMRRAWNGYTLIEQEVALVKRTAIDMVAIVPYSIIMAVPLSPPGHVFAFSLLSRVFPPPTPFTRQRQDITEMYTTIAAEAAAETSESQQWQRDVSQRAVRRWKGMLQRTGLRRRGGDSKASPSPSPAIA